MPPKKKMLKSFAECKEVKQRLDRYLEAFRKASQNYRQKNKDNPDYIERRKINNAKYYEKNKEQIQSSKTEKEN